MKLPASLVPGLLAAALAVGCSRPAAPAPAPTPNASQGARNPFGVKLEPNPDDEEARAFARQANLSGGAADPNAAQWAEKVAAGQRGSLDGDWSGRWKFHGEGKPWVGQTKPTKVATAGDRVYVLFRYPEGAYLVVAVREGDRLVGRFMGVDEPRDTGVYAGRVVDDERIDGEWRGPAGAGRWDFRRKLN